MPFRMSIALGSTKVSIDNYAKFSDLYAPRSSLTCSQPESCPVISRELAFNVVAFKIRMQIAKRNLIEII